MLRHALALALCLTVSATLAHAFEDEEAPHCYPVPKMPKGFENIEHIIVIYQENWSFDSLYGHFPNCKVRGTKAIEQIGLNCQPLVLLKPAGSYYHTDAKSFPDVDLNFTRRPYDLSPYIASNTYTGDLPHLFFLEQAQINHGKMNMFYACSGDGGLTMSYYDASDMPEGKLAQEFTLCDNFFHAAFGGSFLNHQFLVAARPPIFRECHTDKRYTEDDAAVLQRARTSVTPIANGEKSVTSDGYAVNTLYSVYPPFDPKAKPPATDMNRLPPQTHKHIGDSLNDAGVKWAWYSGDFAAALKQAPTRNFQYHHQPLTYFKDLNESTEIRDQYLKDETVFVDALEGRGELPAVSFVKFVGDLNAHPDYANLDDGQKHCAEIVEKIRQSQYWCHCAIIIAYDEHGGRWDHVAPPNLNDRFGPGSRVPCIVISPFAKRGHIDHTQYTTCSILKFIESRFQLRPLTFRDAKANNFEHAFDFKQ